MNCGFWEAWFDPVCFYNSFGHTTSEWIQQLSSLEFTSTAIPFMLLAVLLEILVAVFTKRQLYNWQDSIINLSHGMLSDLLIGPIIFPIADFYLQSYIWTHYGQRWCLPTISSNTYNSPSNFTNSTLSNSIPQNHSLCAAWARYLPNWLTIVILLLLIDLGYYWMHRAAHELSIFWASHRVHHSSHEYNLTVALRQGIGQRGFSILFFLPLSLFVPPGLFWVHRQVNTLYQFWIHTQIIDKLPWWIELVFNTPSHHRVHHGRNPQYLDKNYGGILIIYDRLFGTFQAEEREGTPVEDARRPGRVGQAVVYGLVHPEPYYNVFLGQIAHYVWISKQWLDQTNWRDRLKVLVFGPGWTPTLSPRRLGPSYEDDAPELTRHYVEALDAPAHLVQHPTCIISFVCLHTLVVLFLTLVNLPILEHSAPYYTYVWLSLGLALGLYANSNMMDTQFRSVEKYSPFQWFGPTMTYQLVVLSYLAYELTIQWSILNFMGFVFYLGSILMTAPFAVIYKPKPTKNIEYYYDEKQQMYIKRKKD